MAISLLGAAAVAASCGSQAASELELAELRAELRVPVEFASEALEEEDEPEPPPECECGPMVSRPPPECPRARWFCNAVGFCSCDAPSASSTLESIAALAPVRTADASGPAKSESDSPAATARAIRPSLTGTGDLPLRDGSDDPGCKCLGATVSPPQGGCALVDWFCNASGLCRCRS